MNEKEIQSFSLETLLTVNEPRPEDLYFDGCLIASRVKIMDTVNIDLFRYPTRLDAFAILFCSEGSISFTSDCAATRSTRRCCSSSCPARFCKWNPSGRSPRSTR